MSEKDVAILNSWKNNAKSTSMKCLRCSSHFKVIIENNIVFNI